MIVWSTSLLIHDISRVATQRCYFSSLFISCAVITVGSRCASVAKMTGTGRIISPNLSSYGNKEIRDSFGEVMYSHFYRWRVKVGSLLPVTPESAAMGRKIVTVGSQAMQNSLFPIFFIPGDAGSAFALLD